VKEQSHKDEMRAALRGDFERMRARKTDGGESESDPAATSEEATSPTVVAVEDASPSWLDRWRARR
jgi:hypothetical protein